MTNWKLEMIESFNVVFINAAKKFKMLFFVIKLYIKRRIFVIFEFIQ